MYLLDRVKVVSTSTGTGNFTLGSALAGFKSFVDGTYYYVIDNQAGDWEMGLGTISGSTLTRSPILSSNSNNLVNFSSGTKFVFSDLPTAIISELAGTNKIPMSITYPFLDPTWLSGRHQIEMA